MSRTTCRLSAFAMALLLCGPSAWAYRPFDGTDAAVAEEGVFELEAGVGRVHFGDIDSIAIPSMVFNYGLARDTEIVIEGQINHEIGGAVDGHRTQLGDTALSLKHVFVHGTLQDGIGVSVAGECAVLLPEVHGASGAGAACAGIFSNKWDAMTMHLNVGLGRTREHQTARSISFIAEGPEKWPVRPVAELLAERDVGGGRLKSALIGAIYQHGEDLAVDVGFRHARTNDAKFNEVRVGLTWNFAVGK